MNSKYTFPEDSPEHPDHDAAVTRAWEGDKRMHCDLRNMVDSVCKGLLPSIQERIKDAARRAYYLGCADGIQLEKDSPTAEEDVA